MPFQKILMIQIQELQISIQKILKGREYKCISVLFLLLSVVLLIIISIFVTEKLNGEHVVF